MDDLPFWGSAISWRGTRPEGDRAAQYRTKFSDPNIPARCAPAGGGERQIRIAHYFWGTARSAKLPLHKGDPMTLKPLSLAALLFAATAVSTGAAQAATKTYQVTGPVLEVSDTMITVQKGKEKWEIERTKDTKVAGELKVGAKVTIEYRMTATSVEAKGDKTAAKADAKAETKDTKGAKK
jgi:hypothetical protein